MTTEVTTSPQTAARSLLAYYGLLGASDGTIQPWRDALSGESGVKQALLRLEVVQVDPISAVERNHHLVLFNRIGGYHPELLEGLFPRGQTFEYLANARCILPMESFPDFWPIMLQARANAAAVDGDLRHAMDQVLRHAAQVESFGPREVGNGGPV